MFPATLVRNQTASSQIDNAPSFNLARQQRDALQVLTELCAQRSTPAFAAANRRPYFRP